MAVGPLALFARRFAEIIFRILFTFCGRPLGRDSRVRKHARGHLLLPSPRSTLEHSQQRLMFLAQLLGVIFDIHAQQLPATSTLSGVLGDFGSRFAGAESRGESAQDFFLRAVGADSIRAGSSIGGRARNQSELGPRQGEYTLAARRAIGEMRLDPGTGAACLLLGMFGHISASKRGVLFDLSVAQMFRLGAHLVYISFL
jgi:hypothetical protein